AAETGIAEASASGRRLISTDEASMYGVKPDHLKYLAHLRGATVVQVCVGQFDLQFNFHPAGNLSIGGRCELVENSGAIVDFWDSGKRSPGFRFLELLGEMISEVVIDSPKTVDLAFSNGRHLRLIDNSEQYESFSIGSLIV